MLNKKYLRTPQKVKSSLNQLHDDRNKPQDQSATGFLQHLLNNFHSINLHAVKKDQEWENGKQVKLNTKKTEKKDVNKKTEKKDVNLEKERKKLEKELKKLQEEKNKAKQAADKQKNIDAEIRKYFAEASNFERPENFNCDS